VTLKKKHRSSIGLEIRQQSPIQPRGPPAHCSLFCCMGDLVQYRSSFADDNGLFFASKFPSQASLPLQIIMAIWPAFSLNYNLNLRHKSGLGYHAQCKQKPVVFSCRKASETKKCSHHPIPSFLHFWSFTLYLFLLCICFFWPLHLGINVAGTKAIAIGRLLDQK
jgi:hypothetical protein